MTLGIVAMAIDARMERRRFNSSAPRPSIPAAPPADSSTKTTRNDQDATEPEPPRPPEDESATR